MIDGALLHEVVSTWDELEEDRKAIIHAQKELIDQASESGLDKKLLRKFIAEHHRGLDDVQVERDSLDEYHNAWLEFDSTPLGSYAKLKLVEDEGESPKRQDPMFDA